MIGEHRLLATQSTQHKNILTGEPLRMTDISSSVLLNEIAMAGGNAEGQGMDKLIVKLNVHLVALASGGKLLGRNANHLIKQEISRVLVHAQKDAWTPASDSDSDSDGSSDGSSE